MDILNKQQYFTEFNNASGLAFSLEINKKLHEEQTAYQKIELFETKHFGNLMVIDGFIMLSTRDNFLYHEMMSHPALFSHPSPKHVVIVGGGDCGTLQQVSKHQCVEKISQIEIDKRVTDLSETYFPELCTANQDSRVSFEFCDAIEWMNQVRENSVDIIIVDSTDPIGPAEGLFQKEFYQNCLSALTRDGLLIQQSESPILHWESITHPMRIEMKSAGFNQTNTLFFPQPVYPSGWWSATIAAKNNIHLVRDKDARQLAFNTNYYNYDIHLAAFATPGFLRTETT